MKKCIDGCTIEVLVRDCRSFYPVYGQVTKNSSNCHMCDIGVYHCGCECYSFTRKFSAPNSSMIYFKQIK